MWMQYVICWEVEGEPTRYLGREILGDSLRFLDIKDQYCISVFNFRKEAEEVFFARCKHPPHKGEFKIKYLGLAEDRYFVRSLT